MKSRILKVRKDNKLTQDAFAERLTLSKNYVWQMEKGERNPSDRTIKDICREFNISEAWLRDGIGEMYIENTQEDRYLANVAKLQRADDETIIRWVNMIAETNPDVLKQIESFMKKLLEIE